MAEINHGFATVNAFFSLLCFASYLYEERLNFCRLNSWKVKGSCRNANFACSGNFVWASEGSNIYAASNDFLYYPLNVSVTRTTPAGIAAYRSALTLDWLAAEDNRQRELASAFETESAPPARVISTDCIGYPRPAPGKIARLMLEFLKNLEGDEGVMIPELIQALIRTKLLVETSMMDAEPDFEALVHTPAVMMGEPHTTFPRILAMLWIVVTDPTTTKKYGWCSIKKVNKFLLVSKPIEIAKQMKILEPILARARFIMEEFIQNVTPLNIYEKRSTLTLQLQTIKPVTDKNKNAKRPARKHEEIHKMAAFPAFTSFESPRKQPNFPDNRNVEKLTSGCSLPRVCKFLPILFVVK